MIKEYKTISKIAGPLVFVKKTHPVGYSELVTIKLPDGTIKQGQVLDTSEDLVVVQVFEGTSRIDRNSWVKFLGETIKIPVSESMLGRILNWPSGLLTQDNSFPHKSTCCGVLG